MSYFQRGIGDASRPPWYCYGPLMTMFPSCLAAVGIAAAEELGLPGSSSGSALQTIEDYVHNALYGNLTPDQLQTLKDQGHSDLMKACAGDQKCYAAAVAKMDAEMDAAAKVNPFPWKTVLLVGGGLVGALVLSSAVKNFA